jgi:hypothetical protein
MEDGWSLPCTVRGNYLGEESLNLTRCGRMHYSVA